MPSQFYINTNQEVEQKENDKNRTHWVRRF